MPEPVPREGVRKVEARGGRAAGNISTGSNANVSVVGRAMESLLTSFVTPRAPKPVESMRLRTS
jgi:hypothetical protein